MVTIITVLIKLALVFSGGFLLLAAGAFADKDDTQFLISLSLGIIALLVSLFPIGEYLRTVFDYRREDRLEIPPSDM